MSRKPLSAWRTLLEICVLVTLIAGVVVAVRHFRHRKEPDSLNVPLGVEQAAIVTYSGPLLIVAPYKWGVAVNVRIAQVSERDGARVYDVRYIVNRAGTFDLKDYLIAADGSVLDGLPSFRFAGDPKLSKNLDQRIHETEEIRLEVGGRYYETMAALGLVWIVWLLLLIFYKRPAPPAAPAAVPPGPTLADMMRSFLTQLEAGTLDAASKARLEMILLQCWRQELALGDAPMASVLDHAARDERTGEPLRKLQHWLYHPASPVQSVEIAEILTAYTHEAKPAEAAAAS